MAKPTKNALPIVIGVGVIAFIGVVLGFLFVSATIALAFLLPTIVYELYRVEGKSTIYASWGLLFVLVAELVLLIFKIEFDLAEFLDMQSKYIQGYEVPLTDIKVLGPILLAILSLVLIKNTRGVYTKALSVIILVASFAIVFMINPDVFGQMIEIATEEGINKIDTL